MVNPLRRQAAVLTLQVIQPMAVGKCVVRAEIHHEVHEDHEDIHSENFIRDCINQIKFDKVMRLENPVRLFPSLFMAFMCFMVDQTMHESSSFTGIGIKTGRFLSGGMNLYQRVSPCFIHHPKSARFPKPKTHRR